MNTLIIAYTLILFTSLGVSICQYKIATIQSVKFFKIKLNPRSKDMRIKWASISYLIFTTVLFVTSVAIILAKDK